MTDIIPSTATKKLALSTFADSLATGTAGTIHDAGNATLATTHYSATLVGAPEPLTDAYAFLCIFGSANPASADIALNGGTAQALYINGVAAPAGAITAGCPYLCRSNGTQVEVMGNGPIMVLEATRITSNQTGLSGSSADNTVIFNSIAYNYGPCWSESNGVYTCLIAGRYEVGTQIFNSQASSVPSIKIIKNSTTEARNYPSGTQSPILSLIKGIAFNVNDTLKISVTGATAPIVNYGELNYLQIRKMA